MTRQERAFTEGRWCYYVLLAQDPSKYGGYVPSLVREGIAGHSMLAGPNREPWVWGATLEEAQARCTAFNSDVLGLSEDDSSDIILSSMAAQNREGAS